MTSHPVCSCDLAGRVCTHAAHLCMQPLPVCHARAAGRWRQHSTAGHHAYKCLRGGAAESEGPPGTAGQRPRCAVLVTKPVHKSLSRHCPGMRTAMPCCRDGARASSAVRRAVTRPVPDQQGAEPHATRQPEGAAAAHARAAGLPRCHATVHCHHERHLCGTGRPLCQPEFADPASEPLVVD